MKLSIGHGGRQGWSLTLETLRPEIEIPSSTPYREFVLGEPQTSLVIGDNVGPILHLHDAQVAKVDSQGLKRLCEALDVHRRIEERVLVLSRGCFLFSREKDELAVLQAILTA